MIRHKEFVIFSSWRHVSFLDICSYLSSLWLIWQLVGALLCIINHPATHKRTSKLIKTHKKSIKSPYLCKTHRDFLVTSLKNYYFTFIVILRDMFIFLLVAFSALVIYHVSLFKYTTSKTLLYLKHRSFNLHVVDAKNFSIGWPTLKKYDAR